MKQKFTTRLDGSLSNYSRTVTTALAALAILGVLAGAMSGGVVAATTGGSSTAPSGPAQTNTPHLDATNGSSSPLIVTDSIVVSGGSPGPNEGGCSVQNRFYRGQTVVWRVKVINPQTGKQMDNTTLQNVTVHFDNGNGGTKTLAAEWGKHESDHFWTAAWKVPSSYPAGQVNYSISVTNHQANKVNFAVTPSELTVVDKSLKEVKQNASSSGSGSQSQSAPASSNSSGSTSASLPWIFWLVVVVVAVVVIGLVWNGERQ